MGDFRWTKYITIAMNRSKIVGLAEERKGETLIDMDGNEIAKGYASGNYFIGEGLEFRTWRLKHFAGINDVGLPTWYVRNSETGEMSTTTDYSAATFFASKSSQPKALGGFGGSFGWKSLQLSYAFAYRIGGYGLDAGYTTLMRNPGLSNRTGHNYHKDVKNSWTPENPNSDLARWQFNDRNTTATSDRWLTKLDYLGLQNIALSYEIPKKYAQYIGVAGVTASVGIDNVFILTHRQGFIPSRSFDGSVDFGYYPEMTRYMFNLSVKF
jgi:hypothetical protein